MKSLRLNLQIDPSVTHKIISHGVIYAIWHDSLMALPLLETFFSSHKKNIYILISKSRDGNIPALLAESYPYIQTIRVGHNQRALALTSAVRYLNEKSSILITPDGPKGPRHTIKEGIIRAAQLSKKPIIPISAQYKWKYSFSSWDRFQIPIPFSQVTIRIGAPILSLLEGDQNEAFIEAIKNNLMF